MNKLLPVILLSFVFLFLFSGPVYATLCDESIFGGESNGMVPCGRNVDATGVPTCRCELGHIFILMRNVYYFITLYITAPLAAILIVAGGIMYILAGGKPELASKAKTMLWGAAWGVLLILGSWVIVDVVLRAIGYTGVWNSISF